MNLKILLLFSVIISLSIGVVMAPLESYGEGFPFFDKSFPAPSGVTFTKNSIATDMNDNVYVGGQECVTDASSNTFCHHTVVKFNKNGGFLTKWGQRCVVEDPVVPCVDQPFALFNIVGLATSKNGNDFVYVADSSGFVKKYTSAGSHEASWNTVNVDDVSGIDTDHEDNVYVVDNDFNRVVKYNENGGFIGWQGNCTSGDNCFLQPGHDVGISKGFTCNPDTCSGITQSSLKGSYSRAMGIDVDPDFVDPDFVENGRFWVGTTGFFGTPRAGAATLNGDPVTGLIADSKVPDMASDSAHENYYLLETGKSFDPNVNAKVTMLSTNDLDVFLNRIITVIDFLNAEPSLTTTLTNSIAHDTEGSIYLPQTNRVQKFILMEAADIRVTLHDPDRTREIPAGKEFKLNLVTFNSGTDTARDVSTEVTFDNPLVLVSALPAGCSFDGLTLSCIIGDVEPGINDQKNLRWKADENISEDFTVAYTADTSTSTLELDENNSISDEGPDIIANIYLEPIFNKNAVVGEILEIPVEAFDPQGDPIVLSMNALDFAFIVDNDDGTGEVVVMANAKDTGPTEITVTATDDKDNSFSRMFTVFVQCPIEDGGEGEAGAFFPSIPHAYAGVGPPIPDSCGADIQITKSTSQEVISSGDTFSYFLTVKNIGPEVAESVFVIDELPFEEPLDTAFIEVIPGSPVCMFSSGEITCELGDMIADEEKIIEIIVKTNDDAPLGETILNEAMVESDIDDPQPLNNVDVLSFEIDVVTWDGEGDGINWSDKLNWDTDDVPNSKNQIIIKNAIDPVQLDINHEITDDGSLTIIGPNTLEINLDKKLSNNSVKTITIASGATLINRGLIENFAIVVNEGTIDNNGGTIDNKPESKFFNDRRLNNNCGGEIIREEIISGRIPVENPCIWDGNSDGDGDNTNWSDRFNWTTDSEPKGKRVIKIDDGNAMSSVVHLDTNFVLESRTFPMIPEPHLTISSGDKLIVDAGNTLEHKSDEPIVIDADGTLENNGNLVSNGDIENKGNLINSGDFANNGKLENFLLFENKKTFTNNAETTNSEEGKFTNFAESTFQNTNMFQNDGEFINEGGIINFAILNNDGFFDNKKTILNSGGTITNTCLLNNAFSSDENGGGALTNLANIQNSGTIAVQKNGNFQSSGTVSGISVVTIDGPEIPVNEGTVSGRVVVNTPDRGFLPLFGVTMQSSTIDFQTERANGNFNFIPESEDDISLKITLRDGPSALYPEGGFRVMHITHDNQPSFSTEKFDPCIGLVFVELNPFKSTVLLSGKTTNPVLPNVEPFNRFSHLAAMYYYLSVGFDFINTRLPGFTPDDQLPIEVVGYSAAANALGSSHFCSACKESGAPTINMENQNTAANPAAFVSEFAKGSQTEMSIDVLYHEFTHFIQHESLIGREDRFPTSLFTFHPNLPADFRMGAGNHDGYSLTVSNDATSEGFATFLGAVIQNEMLSDSAHAKLEPDKYGFARSKTSLENRWTHPVGWDPSPFRFNPNNEEFTYASLLWDIYDNTPGEKSRTLQLIDTNPPVSIQNLWAAFHTPANNPANPEIFTTMNDVLTILGPGGSGLLTNAQLKSLYDGFNICVDGPDPGFTCGIQNGFPDATTTDDGGWVETGCSAGNLHECVDEESSDKDTTKLVSTGNGDKVEVEFPPFTDPAVDGGHVVRIWAIGDPGNSGPSEKIKVVLKEGGTTRCTLKDISLSNTKYYRYTRVCTDAEANAITDYSALRVELTSVQGNTEKIHVSTIEIQLPAAPGALPELIGQTGWAATVKDSNGIQRNWAYPIAPAAGRQSDSAWFPTLVGFDIRDNQGNPINEVTVSWKISDEDFIYYEYEVVWREGNVLASLDMPHHAQTQLTFSKEGFLPETIVVDSADFLAGIGAYDEPNALSFEVIMRTEGSSPTQAELIQSLIDDVDTLVPDQLNSRTARALQWLLNAALSAEESGDHDAALQKLQSFNSRATMFMNRGIIPTDIGQQLIDSAQAIIDGDPDRPVITG